MILNIAVIVAREPHTHSHSLSLSHSALGGSEMGSMECLIINRVYVMYREEHCLFFFILSTHKCWFRKNGFNMVKMRNYLWIIRT